MKILTRKEIEKNLSIAKTLDALEQGFAAYSKGETVIPPVASLHFEDPPGDCHIKYGYRKNGQYYVVKIASGFPNNPENGLPSGNGLMLLFDQLTGAPAAMLLDEGYLTDMRTAGAGCIAAKYLAPKNVTCVGIVGTGAQAFYQLKLLGHAVSCRQAMIWGRNSSKAQSLKNHPDLAEWKIEIAKSLDDLTAHCNLIVTTTSSFEPLLHVHQIRPGTHITAIGADDIGKQELDPKLFQKADKVIVDSRTQCQKLGDTSYALQQNLLKLENIVEIGEVISNPSLGRNSESQITIADFTGIAIQDLQIATQVFSKNPNHH